MRIYHPVSPAVSTGFGTEALRDQYLIAPVFEEGAVTAFYQLEDRIIVMGAVPVDGIRSCQLVMGCTEVAAGSVWNTRPPHLHLRRSEVYFFFDMDPDQVVFHLMGTPEETRHLVMRNGEAVFSPSWSIHAGAGTGSYKFVWAMAGENQTFTDLDALSLEVLR